MTLALRPERKGAAEAAARRDRAMGRTQCRRPLRGGWPGSKSPRMDDGIRWRRRPPRRQSRQSRPYQGATPPRTVWRQSVPRQQQAAGAQFLGGSRGRRGAALGLRPKRGARASLPAAPGIAPSPSEVDAGHGGSRLVLVAPATRGPPTDRQPDGGQGPGAPSRRRG